MSEESQRRDGGGWGRLESGGAAGVWRGPRLSLRGGVWKDWGCSWGPTPELGARAGIGRRLAGVEGGLESESDQRGRHVLGGERTQSWNLETSGQGSRDPGRGAEGA